MAMYIDYPFSQVEFTCDNCGKKEYVEDCTTEKEAKEIINEDNTELDFNLSVFMRHVIKKKEVIFTPTEMIAELNLLITPSRFGILLFSNIKLLEK